MKLSHLLSAITLSLALLPACASGVDCEGSYTYNTDDFTEEQQAEIHNSALRWNTFLGYEKISVRPSTSRSSCSITTAHIPSGAVGTNSSPREIIKIDTFKLAKLDMDNAKYFEAVVLHEIGHSIGFSHIGEPQTALMSAIGAYEFTELDRAECVNIGLCEVLQK